MCGRYSLSSPARLVRQTFGIDDPVELEPRWNVAPSQQAPVVRPAATGERRLDLLRWGLLAENAAAATGGQINARSETVETLPAFRDAFRQRRCLVPADGFYEWLRLEGRRHPFHIRRRDRGLLAFAGLWGRRQRRGESPVESFAVLTCPPSELVRPLHDRMPVILPPAAWESWLAAATAAADLRALLGVPPVGDWIAEPVSTAVNSAMNDEPSLVEPIEPDEPRQRSLF